MDLVYVGQLNPSIVRINDLLVRQYLLGQGLVSGPSEKWSFNAIARALHKPTPCTLESFFSCTQPGPILDGYRLGLKGNVT